MVIILLLYRYYRRYTRIRKVTLFPRTPPISSHAIQPHGFSQSNRNEHDNIVYVKYYVGAPGNSWRFDRIFVSIRRYDNIISSALHNIDQAQR